MGARGVLALLVALTTLLSGCGPWADPVVRSEGQVLDALVALRDGAELRATAELALDEDELRDALRDDREALRLFREALDGGGVTDVDTMLRDLARAQAELARHAVLLSTGTDGSTRVAAEHDGTVWADLRFGSSTVADDRLLLDVQARVDWATASEVLDEPDLLGQLDDAAAVVAPLLGGAPELGAVERLVLGFLAGELVGVRGEVGPDLLAGLGLDDDAGSPRRGPADLVDDPRALLDTALHLDGHRRDGEDTVVDVSVELTAVGELVLDEVAAAPDLFGTTYEEVEEARAELADLPARLTDVATLRFDGAGLLRSLRLDVLDVALQLEQAGDPDDERLAAAARLAGALDTSGLFVHVEVEGLGAIATVLGDPTATAAPADLAAAFGTLVLGGLAGLGDAPWPPGAPRQLDEPGRAEPSEPEPTGGGGG